MAKKFEKEIGDSSVENKLARRKKNSFRGFRPTVVVVVVVVVNATV